MKTTNLLATLACAFICFSCSSQVSYKINATGQTQCYDANGNVIDTPQKGDPLYGQDANYIVDSKLEFKDNGDGTVTDSNTGLMWQQTPPMEGMTWAEAKEYCENLEFGGYSDWRLPTAKELFSISDFNEGWPYLDTTFFKLATGRVTKDEQFWADHKYVGETVEGRNDAAFGVNHVTGHIKAYPAGSNMRRREGEMGNDTTQQRPPMRQRGERRDEDENGEARQRPPMPQGNDQNSRPMMMGNPMAKQVRAVRGNIYGENKFVDNGDGTISDKATGLMWAKDDNGKGIEWTDALIYAEGATLAGYSDWRLPNVKELQSIVDYSRAPSNETLEAAIDPIFNCTQFVNEAKDADFGYYWTNTSACFRKGTPYYFAWYVAFGRAVNNQGKDFHGAGAVRFDSKANNDIAVEGGEERYHNFVRLVRDVK